MSGAGLFFCSMPWKGSRPGIAFAGLHENAMRTRIRKQPMENIMHSRPRKAHGK
jgi:hypothetical protein